MTFHRVRLSAALKAFQKNQSQTNHQKWWMQNLGFELDSALTYVGLCATHNWTIPVPNLIRMLALLDRTESYVLLTSQIWEVFYLSDEFDSFTNRLDLAWWAHPDGRNGRFTSDELNEAFGQFLVQVPPGMVEIETGCHCQGIGKVHF